MNRLRIFLRDPMGAVTRNGVFEEGANVYLNYDNDILLENRHPSLSLTVVQHGQPVGVPAPLSCLFNMVCVASGYPAPQIGSVAGASVVAMTNKVVQFRDGDGRDVVVKLR